MQATSPVSAAFGIVEFDALNDLADWLDGRIEPVRTAYQAGWRNLAGEPAAPAAGRKA
jgi:hypothetical protein